MAGATRLVTEMKSTQKHRKEAKPKLDLFVFKLLTALVLSTLGFEPKRTLSLSICTTECEDIYKCTHKTFFFKRNKFW